MTSQLILQKISQIRTFLKEKSHIISVKLVSVKFNGNMFIKDANSVNISVGKFRQTTRRELYGLQWRIQDFQGACQLPRGGPSYYFSPQRSWGKVMFLQASVILSTGGST